MYDEVEDGIHQDVYRYHAKVGEMNRRSREIGEAGQDIAVKLAPYAIEQVRKLLSSGERAFDTHVLTRCSRLMSGKVSRELWEITLRYLVRHGKLMRHDERLGRDDFCWYTLP